MNEEMETVLLCCSSVVYVVDHSFPALPELYLKFFGRFVKISEKLTREYLKKIFGSDIPSSFSQDDAHKMQQSIRKTLHVFHYFGGDGDAYYLYTVIMWGYIVKFPRFKEVHI